jgi:hypothetical protein
LPKPSTHIMGMKGNVEVALNQFRDTAGRPEVGRKAVSGGFLGQPDTNLLVLFVGEIPGPSRGRLGGQAGRAIGSVAGHPLGHGDGMNLKCLSDSSLGLSLQDTVDGAPTEGFEFGGRSFASHPLTLTQVSADCQ